MSQSDQSSLRIRATLGNPYTAANLWSALKAPYMVAMLEAVARSSGVQSEDAKLLLVLLSFLSVSDKVPVDLLCRGAAPRKRWTAEGEIEALDAFNTGLAPELCDLLSDMSRLGDSFQELELLLAVFKNEDQTYALDDVITSRVRERLPADQLSFWKCQALIVAYRAVPWKYIESNTKNTKLFLPHIKFTLQAIQGYLNYVSTSTRADLVLTLSEASRFPNMAWKRFAVSQAEIVSRGLDEWHLQSCIGQSQCVLSRISGNMDHAGNSLNDLRQSRVAMHWDNRMHLAIGQEIVQQALNCVQVEDLSTAKGLLEDWSPLTETPSSIEQVVVFRKHMILGRILRFQGAFTESLAHFEKAQTISQQCKDVTFDEDLRDLTCDYADTLRELDDTVSAELQLRAEITRQDYSDVSLRRSLLDLSLAEVLFAQQRVSEAEELCLEIESRAGLLKYEQLRLHITLAKIRHIKLDDEGASSYWAKAMVAVGKFPNESGVTRIIVKSVCDILRRQQVPVPDNNLLDQSLQTLDSMDKLEKPGGIRCWIAGLRHWVDYLQSGSKTPHSLL